MSHRIMFLRDSNNQPVGCLAISIAKSGEVISYGLSVLHPTDKFNRCVARQLAIGRLVEFPTKIQGIKNAKIHTISTLVMSHIASSNAPTRAVKSARSWIRSNG